MAVTIKTSTKRPATLGNVVEVLEQCGDVLGVDLAAIGPIRYIKTGDKWVQIGDVTRVQLRLAFERAGFRPVSSRLLKDALAVAQLPSIGS